ncbi:hypothetical protein C7J99_23290 [Brevibacillus brevis]|nr:hypothetical protein C7J99_23290 [Brevibacillus brevis]
MPDREVLIAVGFGYRIFRTQHQIPKRAALFKRSAQQQQVIEMTAVLTLLPKHGHADYDLLAARILGQQDVHSSQDEHIQGIGRAPAHLQQPGYEIRRDWKNTFV